MRKQAIGQLGQRIKGLREGLGLNQKEFARGLRLSNTYLSELEKGRSAPGYDFFFHASRHYKINPLFLLHGYEPRFIPQEEPEEEKVQDTDRERETPPPNPWEVLEFGENTPQIRRMLEDIEKSQVVKFAVLGFYTRYVIENRQVIEVEMGEDRRQEK